MCDFCGQVESVKHFIQDCRQWKAERGELRDTVTDKSRWGDLPYLLGGWSGKKDHTGNLIDGKLRLGSQI